MKKRSILAAALFVAVAGVLPSGSPPAGETGISVAHPWARPTLPNRPGAGYLGIHNSGQADRLIDARAEGVERVEIHAVETAGDVVKMRRLDGLEVPANDMVHLGPGGTHLMLFGIDDPLTEGDILPVTLIFERAGEVAVDFAVTRGMPQHGHGTRGKGNGHGGGGHGQMQN